MHISNQRVLWCGLGLSPALAKLLLPSEILAQAVSALGVPATLAVFIALALFVTQAASQPGGGTDPPLGDRPGLLTRRTHRNPPADLPDPDEQRRRLGRILAAQETPVSAHLGWREPQTADQALAATLRRVMATWKAPGPDSLTIPQMRELFLLQDLICAPSRQAGVLALCFRSPEAVLHLRDRIRAIRRRRTAFETQHAAFMATRRLWRDRGAASGPTPLSLALQALECPDPDLWHRVVAAHDPQDPPQRDAALWCVGQPECDRATVALYFARMAAQGWIDEASERGDDAWLAKVRQVIDSWNSGTYRRQDIALDQVDMACAAESVLAGCLDRQADRSGCARWPDPEGLFGRYDGRRPQPRSHWSLRDGHLTGPPLPAHYFDVAAHEPTRTFQAE